MTLSVRVSKVLELNPLVRQFTLVGLNEEPLPGFTAGAHIRIQVDLPGGQKDWRHYSLVELDPAADITAPRSYTIAVRREDTGRGGSVYMHSLRSGDALTVDIPRNDFPLDVKQNAVLVAGGIGITPLASMAATCRAKNLPVKLHYAGLSRDSMAFLAQLSQLLGSDLHIHEDAVAGTPLDIDAVLSSCAGVDHLYVCGPKALLDNVLEKTKVRGWASSRIHYELFTSPQAAAGDRPFEVVLAHAGKTLLVGAKQTLLDCLLDAGCDPMFDCKRGECGVCSATVLEGDIDHRDYFLSDQEKASGKVMQICVSRARGAKLVLDL